MSVERLTIRRDPKRRNAPLCTATSKRTGEPCGCIADRGSTVCRCHGSRGGRPITKGLHSKHLPKHLMETYEATLAETDPFRLTEKVAIQNALINQHLETIGKVPPLEAIRAVRAGLRQLQATVAETTGGLPIEVHEECLQLEALLVGMDHAHHAESQVRLLMLEQTKVVHAEAVRVERSKKYLTVEQAAAMVAAVITVVNKHVSDTDEKEKVASELISLISTTDS